MRAAVTVFLFILAAAASAEDVTRHGVLFQGKITGAQVVKHNSDGSLTVDYSYRDNGRGPDFLEQIRLAPDGTLASYSVKGKATYGAPVAEYFSRKGNSARWSSSADKGTTTVTGPAVYVPVQSSFEPFALITRVASRQPQGQLAALPSGAVKVEKLRDLQVSGASGTIGVSLYGVTGIDARPGFIWLTNDAAQRFFA